MSPESLTHARIIKYLEQLLDAYFALNPIGDVLTAPFVMRLDATESIRERIYRLCCITTRATSLKPR